MKKTCILFIIVFLAAALGAVHFVPAWQDPYQNPYLAMNILIYGAEVNGVPLGAGDEIAAFDGNTCVGAKVLTGIIELYHPILLNCSMDGGGVPGSAIPGHFILFKLWHAATDTEYSYPDISAYFAMQPTWPDNWPTVFETQGTTHILMLKYDTPYGKYTRSITPPPGPGGGYVQNQTFPGTNVTLEQGYVTAGGGGNMTVIAFDELSTDQYYAEGTPGGTVPVPDFSPYGWYIDPGSILFYADSTYPISFTIYIGDLLDGYTIGTGGVGIYRRDIHGAGPYAEVQSSYNAQTQTITFYISDLADLPGEFILTGLLEDQPTPVQFSSLTALMNVSNSGVNLLWSTETESNLLGFEVLRGDSADLAQALNLAGLVPATNTSQYVLYQYSDLDVAPEHTYYYWVEAIELNGVVQFHGPVSISIPAQTIETPAVPLVTGLSSLFPNPFNPELTINYSLATPAPVSLCVRNSRGQTVRRLLAGNSEAGRFTLIWDGRDDSGNSCSSGLYLISLTAGKDTFYRKAVLLK